MIRPTALALLALVAGCADRPEIPRTPSGGPSLGAPHVPWKHKTEEEQMAFMAAHVEPKMRQVFQKQDPEYYSDFDCTTCHGKEAELVDFHMPNDLYGLPADNPMAEAMDYDPDVAAFMAGTVMPAMAKLLAEDVGPKGVSCHTCHPEE